MVKATVVISISCIINDTDLFYRLNNLFNRGISKVRLFTYITLVTSVATFIFRFNQIIAIILTEQLLEETYTSSPHNRNKLAINIKNTAVIIVSITPWNITAYIPTTTLIVHFYN